MILLVKEPWEPPRLAEVDVATVEEALVALLGGPPRLVVEGNFWNVWVNDEAEAFGAPAAHRRTGGTQELMHGTIVMSDVSGYDMTLSIEVRNYCRHLEVER